MTSAQTTLYWREWGALTRLCKAKGWPVPDRAELHLRALRYSKSSKLLTNAEFDKVLGVFRGYSQHSNVNAQIRQERMPRTRLEHKIKIDQVKLLSVVLARQAREGLSEHPEFTAEGAVVPAAFMEPDLEAAWTYVASVMRERFGTEDLTEISDAPQPRFLRKAGRPVLRDGQPIVVSEDSDLECLRNTLAARINALRNGRVPKGARPAAHGWSIHDVNAAAGVACEGSCRRCHPRFGGTVPVVPAEA